MAPFAVAIPLYIYPEVHNWDALVKVIAEYPHAHFNIVINPFNGPGGIVPDSNYIREVARLNNFKNVAIFGYVHVSWANRDLELVIKDLVDWGRWREYREADIHVDGIFVDEAPSDPSHVKYMAQVYQQSKLNLGKDAAVWTNPGVEIDQAFYTYADLVNSHENSHAAWLGRPRDLVNHKSTTMIHSYTGSTRDVQADLDALRQQGYGSILITTDDCYTSFSEHLSVLAQSACS